ncbi:hypothetical protein PPL_10193 [Heterostelium album PN500]|uniref:Uncharacterized protein n=1 Tax=Heterostelium pallidum (strain ATCC 26659 / Pp 5 / PN500) TaxID=670386 RepID=D3BQK8_HETP5|nr:hypothetical protein PPL_10193 [Heterostelium album PN500]EFA76428.1 hypothetical protein PPL_10193 [Heterostelium album PN500]|eukprot:XP_020428560.1 hypothetical protein PPL_10193 [Heterostelium album PN500]
MIGLLMEKDVSSLSLKIFCVDRKIIETLYTISNPLNPVDKGEPPVIDKLIFPYLRSFSFQTNIEKNSSYNIFNLLDNEKNVNLTTVDINNQICPMIPNDFPKYLPLESLYFFVPTLKSIELNEGLSSYSVINFDITKSYPVLETLSLKFKDGRKNIIFDTMTLKTFEFYQVYHSISDYTIFPNLTSLYLFQNNLTGFFGDFGDLEPSSIYISDGERNTIYTNVTTNLFQSNCYTQYIFPIGKLQTKYFPDCFRCYGNEIQFLVTRDVFFAWVNYTCPIKLDKLIYPIGLFDLNKPIKITGENLGWGYNIDPTLSVMIPNKEFQFRNPTRNGETTIHFSVGYNDKYAFNITWGPEILNFLFSF